MNDMERAMEYQVKLAETRLMTIIELLESTGLSRDDAVNLLFDMIAKMIGIDDMR